MRTFGALAVGIALALAYPSAPEAQGASETQLEAKKGAKAARQISGTVRSTSPDVVVVAGRDKGKDAEWSFAVGPTTMIRKGSKSIVPTDLKTGDAVSVRYVERDGKASAETIVVKTPARVAKKTEPK